MNNTVQIRPADANTLQPPAAGPRSPWPGRAIWLALTLMLCTTNLLTLLNQDFRLQAYELVARLAPPTVVEPIGLSGIAKIIAEGDPAAAEKRAVKHATLHLAQSAAVLRAELVSLRDQKARLVVQHQNLQKQLLDSQALMALHRKRVSNLGLRVLSRAGRSVTRHLVALPGHALPVLSATVAVGSVALDINDACESLKELDEINHGVGLPPVNRSSVCGRAVPTPEEILASARGNWKTVYENSARVLNQGAQMIPQSPPSISFEAAKDWLSGTLGR